MSRPAGVIDRFQRRHTWAGFPVAVVYKYADDQAGYLAALLAYYGFLSLFPLLLLLVTVLGFVLEGDPHAQQQVLSSTLAQFPIIGDELRSNVASLHGSTTALVAGAVGSVYGALGVAQAGQNAMNAIWSVPRNSRPNPLRSRVRSLWSVAVLGTGMVATTVLSGLFTAGGAFGKDLGPWGTLLALVLSVLGNAALFLGGFRLLTATHVHMRDFLPGALAAAVAWQLLQALAALLVAHQLQRASQVYGLFAIVLGLVGWLYLAAVTTLLCAEVNVVRCRRLWPRALVTPFTDDVDLTSADEREYTALATTQRTKGFEEIEVSFERPQAGG